MKSNHLVVLGRKANSWAWGIERINFLAQEGGNPQALDFDFNAKKMNPRTRFQSSLLAELNVFKYSAESLLNQKQRSRIKQTARKYLLELSDIKTEDWVNSTFNNIPLGRVLMSNYARIAGTRFFELKLIPKNLQQEIVVLALEASAIYQTISSEFDSLSISNGRSPAEAIFLFHAREEGKQTYVMERGASTNQWFTYDTSPHYAPDWWKLLEKINSKFEPQQIQELSKKYWDARLSGWDALSNRNWKNEFEDGKLPPNLPKNPVVFFCTSTHEVPVLSEFESAERGFPTQQSAVRALVEVCDELNLPLVIKRHPNSVGVGGEDREKPDWNWIQGLQQVLYVGPKSRVDTYELVRNARAVVTFRSSVGIEATAMRVPARAAGPAEWAFTDESRVWTRASLKRYLTNPTVLGHEIVEKWGCLANTFGKPLKRFKDITGGYAETLEGERIYSANFYDKSLNKYVRRATDKIWSIRVNHSA